MKAKRVAHLIVRNSNGEKIKRVGISTLDSLAVLRVVQSIEAPKGAYIDYSDLRQAVNREIGSIEKQQAKLRPGSLAHYEAHQHIANLRGLILDAEIRRAAAAA